MFESPDQKPDATVNNDGSNRSLSEGERLPVALIGMVGALLILTTIGAVVWFVVLMPYQRARILSLLF